MARAALAVLLLAGCAQASRPAGAESVETSFAAFLQGVRAQAMARGVSRSTLDAALAGVDAPIPRVIELDRKQPETTQTFAQYRAARVSDARVAMGRRMLTENRALLQRITRRFGVPGRFVVALWGMETNFGQYSGGFPVVAALATLAHDGRRSAYFRDELLDALEILQQGHIAPQAMKGSWAGAMGQVQFMPSSFLRYAIDYDGDGRRDIWATREDVLASAANYLASAGWQTGETWGRAVRLPGAGIAPEAIGLEREKPLAEWAALGLRRADGGPLPEAPALTASLVQPDGSGTPAYLVYRNSRVILKWNRSTYFLLAVGEIADRIVGIEEAR